VIGLILDHTAVRFYRDGRGRVGALIARTSAMRQRIGLPVLALAEGYRHAGPEQALVLDVLANLPAVDILPLDATAAPTLGTWANRLGDYPLAHAVLETASRPVVPLVSALPTTVHRILAEGWPVVSPE